FRVGTSSSRRASSRVQVVANWPIWGNSGNQAGTNDLHHGLIPSCCFVGLEWGSIACIRIEQLGRWIRRSRSISDANDQPDEFFNRSGGPPRRIDNSSSGA